MAYPINRLAGVFDFMRPNRSPDAPAVQIALDNCCCETPSCCTSLDCEPICLSFSNILLTKPDSSTLYTVPGFTVTGYFDTPTGSNRAYIIPKTFRTFLFDLGGGELLNVIAFIEGGCPAITDGLVLQWGLFAYHFTPRATPSTTDTFYSRLQHINRNDREDCNVAGFATPSPVSVSLDPDPGSLSMGASFDYELLASACPDTDCHPLTCTSTEPFREFWFCCFDGASWFGSPGLPPFELTATVIDSTCLGFPIGAALTLKPPQYAYAYLVNGQFMGTWQNASAGQIAGPPFVNCDGTVWDFRQWTSAIGGGFHAVQVGTLGTVHSTSPLDFEIEWTPVDHTFLWSYCSDPVTFRVTE